MLETIKKYLPYGLVLIVMALWFNSCQQSKEAKERFENNLRISRDSTKHFIDKTGQLVSEKETIQLTAKELKEQGELLGIDNSNLKKQVGKLSNLVSYYKGELIAKGDVGIKAHDSSVTVVNKKGDTLGTKVVKKFPNYSNGFLSLNNVVFDPVIDSLNFKYGYKVDLQLTLFKVRHGFLGITKKAEMKAEVRLSDPNARMENSQSVQIIEDKKWYDTDWFWVAVGASVMKVIMLLAR